MNKLKHNKMKNLVTILVLVLGFSAQAQIRNLHLDMKNIVIGIGVEKSGDVNGAVLSVNMNGGLGGEISFGAAGEGSGKGYVGALASYDLFNRKNLSRKLYKNGFNLKIGAGIIANQAYEDISQGPSFSGFTPKYITQVGQTYAFQAKVGVRYKMLQVSIGLGSEGLNVGLGFILKR